MDEQIKEILISVATHVFKQVLTIFKNKGIEKKDDNTRDTNKK
ncbi:MAG: hypothetical protein V1872_07965 [bacterium]